MAKCVEQKDESLDKRYITKKQTLIISPIGHPDLTDL